MAIETDALIIGAGPCGLFQVFELGLLDIKAHVVDSMPRVGGQCSELYPDKPIYDIPAYPIIGAQELVDNLMKQIEPFDPVFHLGQQVEELTKRIDGVFYVKTSTGTEFKAKTIIIAGGVGSFQPRKLRAKEAEQFEGSQIHYKVTDPKQFYGKDIIVLGGGDSALDWTLELQSKVNSLVLIHRRAEYRAAPASVTKMQRLCDNFLMQQLQGNVTGVAQQDGQLSGLEVLCGDSVTRKIEADHVLAFWGLHPKLGPIAEWGLNLQRNQIEVDTEKFQTNQEGIFAVGDINTYPGKKKLILSGFHEAALASFAIKRYINPDEKVHLQYTTTSPKMHQRLGLKNAV